MISNRRNRRYHDTNGYDKAPELRIRMISACVDSQDIEGNIENKDFYWYPKEKPQRKRNHKAKYCREELIKPKSDKLPFFQPNTAIPNQPFSNPVGQKAKECQNLRRLRTLSGSFS